MSSPNAIKHAEASAELADFVDYGFEYDYVSHSATHKSTMQETPDEPAEPSYEFRLFASTSAKPSEAIQPAKSESAAPKITLLRSPSPSTIPLTSEGRLLRPRPDSHYFSKPSLALQSQHDASAISSLAILKLSQTPWPGVSLPWRVSHVRPASSSAKLTNQSQRMTSLARSKPNKKRRILLRRRLAARTGSATKTKAKSAVKSGPKAIVRNETGEIIELTPEERDKRTARNREKKLKRRQRERERKAALAGVAGAGEASLEDD
jgi:hypothetical protein